ncbi:MAG: hypothetical protein ACLU3I_06585 [Acutalibacteraceae bacterium]
MIFVAGILLCSFPIYGRMQKKGEGADCKSSGRVQAAAVAATLEYVQGISVVQILQYVQTKNLSGIEEAYESKCG